MKRIIDGNSEALERWFPDGERGTPVRTWMEDLIQAAEAVLEETLEDLDQDTWRSFSYDSTVIIHEVVGQFVRFIDGRLVQALDSWHRNNTTEED
jgi:hypothetical protein